MTGIIALLTQNERERIGPQLAKEYDNDDKKIMKIMAKNDGQEGARCTTAVAIKNLAVNSWVRV